MLKTLFLYLESRTITTSVYREEPPPELCDEIEHVKSQILEYQSLMTLKQNKSKTGYIFFKMHKYIEKYL